MVKVLWYFFAMDSIPLLQKNKETNYYKISFWTCSICDTLDASMNVSLHGIQLEQNVLKSLSKGFSHGMIGRSSKLFFAFFNICMKGQKACQLIVVWNFDILSKLGTHTKRPKKVLNLSQERYVDLSQKKTM
jgi:hypothetical protein